LQFDHLLVVLALDAERKREAFLLSTGSLDGHRTCGEPQLPFRNPHFHGYSFGYRRPRRIIELNASAFDRDFSKRTGNHPLTGLTFNGMVSLDEGADLVSGRAGGDPGGFVARRDSHHQDDKRGDGGEAGFLMHLAEVQF
jgi:hypothetical protein